jgi:hypothetical protein
MNSPFEASEFIIGYNGVRLSQFIVFCVVFCRYVCVFLEGDHKTNIGDPIIKRGMPLIGQTMIHFLHMSKVRTWIANMISWSFYNYVQWFEVRGELPFRSIWVHHRLQWGSSISIYSFLCCVL